jgi:hypothetical protein
METLDLGAISICTEVYKQRMMRNNVLALSNRTHLSSHLVQHEAHFHPRPRGARPRHHCVSPPRDPPSKLSPTHPLHPQPKS